MKFFACFCSDDDSDNEKSPLKVGNSNGVASKPADAMREQPTTPAKAATSQAAAPGLPPASPAIGIPTCAEVTIERVYDEVKQLLAALNTQPPDTAAADRIIVKLNAYEGKSYEKGTCKGRAEIWANGKTIQELIGFGKQKYRQALGIDAAPPGTSYGGAYSRSLHAHTP